jgi:hypothetical protein
MYVYMHTQIHYEDIALVVSSWLNWGVRGGINLQYSINSKDQVWACCLEAAMLSTSTVVFFLNFVVASLPTHIDFHLTAHSFVQDHSTCSPPIDRSVATCFPWKKKILGEIWRLFFEKKMVFGKKFGSVSPKTRNDCVCYLY